MKLSPILISLSATVFVATPAFAEAGLPQLDASLFPEQLFWLTICFAMLYLLMRFVALPGVERTQDKRKNVIGADIASAKAANEQAKALGHEADKALAEARAQAQATIATIKAEASTTANDQQSMQSKQLNQKLRDAEIKIAATRDAALKDIESAAAGLAASIVDNVVGIKVKA